MRKNYLNLYSLMLFGLLFSTSIYAQTLVEQNRLWSYFTSTAIGGPDTHPDGYNTVYTFGEPEVVDGLTYYRLQTSNDFQYEAYWQNTDFLMREDVEGKVFLKEAAVAEVLIYDFTLEIGDVFDDPLTGCSATLAAKDSIALNSGELRERFILDNDVTWIKGIGSTSAFIGNCDDSETILVCFQSDIDLEYTGELFPESENCLFFPVNTVEAHVENISIFPNPVKHSFTIQSTEIPLTGDLMIYNGIGQQVYQTTLTQTLSKEIDLSTQPAGIYYLEYGEVKHKLIKTD